jgi:hypothetical protein
MKRLFLIPAALLALTSGAHAASPVPIDVLPTAMITQYREGLPPEAIGSKYDLWCYIDKIKAYRRKDCRDDYGFSDSWMSIDSLEHSGHEWSCVVKQIWRLVKGRTYRLDLRCSGLAEFWEERVVLSLSADKKTLYTESEWQSKVRPEKSEDE